LYNILYLTFVITLIHGKVFTGELWFSLLMTIQSALADMSRQFNPSLLTSFLIEMN